MERRYYYAAWTMVRQDLRKNRDKYIWENKAPTPQTIEWVKGMVKANWPILPEDTTLEELENWALEELHRHVPWKYNPKTGEWG